MDAVTLQFVEMTGRSTDPPVWQKTPEETRQGLIELQTKTASQRPSASRLPTGVIIDPETEFRLNIYYPHTKEAKKKEEKKNGKDDQKEKKKKKKDKKKEKEKKKDKKSKEEESDGESAASSSEEENPSPKSKEEWQSSGPLFPVIVYFHGGGWVAGGEITHRGLLNDLADRTGCAIVAPEYTLAPDSQFPETLNQLKEAVDWVILSPAARQRARLDGRRIALAGDSAGGQLCLTLWRYYYELGSVPDFRFICLLYPVAEYDATFSDETYEEFAEGPWLTREAMRYFWHHYLPEEARSDPEVVEEVSPTRWPLELLAELPDVMIVLAEYDVLNDEGRRLASRLIEADVPTSVLEMPGTIHDFLMLNSLAPSSHTQRALDLLGILIREKMLET